MHQTFSTVPLETEREASLKEKERLQAQIEELFKQERDAQKARLNHTQKSSDTTPSSYELEKQEYELEIK